MPTDPELARDRINWRSLLLLIALSGAIVVLARIFDEHYAVKQWLFWRYARAWVCVALFCTACLSVGDRVVRALSSGLRGAGHITLAFATGVFVFFLAVFAFGMLGWLKPFAFFAIPALLIVLGGTRSAGDALRWLRAKRRWTPREPWRHWELALFGLGVLALAIIWVPTLVPENASYDSRWYHLPLAERYVADGAILRFPEGAIFGSIPQLASLLYTWAFLAPRADLFDKVITASQLEVAVFLFTLPGIPWLVRWLVPSCTARIAWVGLFLFPSVLVYDTSLVLGADHVAALWTIPTFMMLQRAQRDLNPKTCCLFTIQLCGLAMTKYTALTAALFPILALLAAAAYALSRRVLGRHRGHNWILGPLVALLTGIVLTAPHWLKNWWWYGDPAYPMLYKHLSERPWTPDAASLYRYYSEEISSASPVSDRLIDVAKGLYDFSYGLYNWESFHGKFPVFGSAFTFSLVALPFVRSARRVWLLAFATLLGVAMWRFSFPQERYLQTLLPWMTCVLVAIILLAWREGFAARVGIVGLLSLQIVWGAEFVFWPMHQVMGKSGIALAGDFFQKTWHGDAASRTQPFDEFAKIGRALPKGARVLLHHEHMRLGLGVPSITDAYRLQYGISYGYIGSPLNLHHALRSFGVTHVIWSPEHVYGEDSLAGEFVFHAYVSRYLVNKRTFGGRTVSELPRNDPPSIGNTVLVYACGRSPYANGLYELSDLRVSPLPLHDQPRIPPPRVPVGSDDIGRLLAEASYAFVDPSCSGAPNRDGFDRIAEWGRTELWLRK